MIENKRNQLEKEGRPYARGLTEEMWNEKQGLITNFESGIISTDLGVKLFHSIELGITRSYDTNAAEGGVKFSITFDRDGNVVPAVGVVGDKQIDLTNINLKDLGRIFYNGKNTELSYMASPTAPALVLGKGSSHTLDGGVNIAVKGKGVHLAGHIGYTGEDKEENRHLIVGGSYKTSSNRQFGLYTGETSEYSWGEQANWGATGKVITGSLSAIFEAPMTLYNVMSNMNNYGYTNKPINIT